MPASVFLGVWTSLLSVGTKRGSRRRVVHISPDVRRDPQVHAMQHVDSDARQQQTNDHAEQRRHWPSLREGLGHVSCVRPPGGTPTRTVANSCPEETTDCVRPTAHTAHIVSCVPGRESEDRAPELPVASALHLAPRCHSSHDLAESPREGRSSTDRTPPTEHRAFHPSSRSCESL